MLGLTLAPEIGDDFAGDLADLAERLEAEKVLGDDGVFDRVEVDWDRICPVALNAA